MQNSKRKRQSGAAMIETALCLTVFTLVLFGLMEFCRFVQASTVLAGAVREGARYAIVHSKASDDAIEAEVRRWMVGLDRNSVHVLTAWSPNRNPGSRVRVRAVYPVSPLTGFLGGDALNLQSQCEMVISQ